MAKIQFLNKPVLVIFCKRPRLGQGKQRLADEIGSAHALKAAGLLLNCALEDASIWEGDVILSPSETSDKKWAQTLIQPEVVVIPQPDKNLGERLNFVDNAVREMGYGRVVFIGTDAPCLSLDIYKDVIRGLEQNDFVLPMSEDGGVTVMAGRKPWPDLSGLPWSSQHLGRTLFKCCKQAGFSVQAIDGGYDVDLKQDLLKAKADLHGDTRTARQSLLAWIHQIIAG